MGVTTTQTNKPFNPRGNDQSPKGFNRAKLYSGKALDFDGTNDELSLDGFTMSGNTATLSFCLKADDWDANSFIFAAGTPEIVLGSTTGGNNLSFYDSSSWKTFGAISDTTSTNFFSIVFSGTSAIAYMNGVKFGNTLTITPINISSVTGVKLMSKYTGDAFFFNGQIAGFKIFNTALTAAQVADLYKNPEKVVPTGVDNTALKLWLPMQEGAGTTALNGAPDAIGSELVTNGDFATDSDWILGGSGSNAATIQNGVAIITSVNGNSYIQQSNVLVTGKKYKIEYTITSSSAGNALKLVSSFGLASIPTSVGTHALIANAVSNTLYIERNYNGASASIDNVSVKELTDFGTISGATWTHGIGAPVAQTSVIDWNKVSDGTNSVLIPQGLTSGRDLLGNLFENVRKQGALNLDGNSWAEVHDNESLDLTDAITLEAWVYWDGSSAKGVLGRWHSDASNRNYLLYKLSATNISFYINSNNLINQSGLTATKGWTHIVGTYNRTNAVLYIDGVQKATVAHTTAISTGTLPVEIGRNFTTANQSLTAPIAQPRIYNRALTAEEVQRNYNAGKNTYTN